MKSLPKFDVDAKTQPLDKLYIKLTNLTLHDNVCSQMSQFARCNVIK